VIPLAIPNLAGNEAAYLQECVDTNFVSSVGPFVDRFERDLERVTASSHAVAASTGTAGLHVALVAAGVRRDDLVVLPSLTFIASANAISLCGATPWLLDVDPASWTLSVDALRDALQSRCERRSGALWHRPTGRRVSAVMPVHTLGVVADMDPLVEIARDFGLAVVADGAASLGADYRGRPLGGTGADLTVLSFNGNKTVTAGGGGAVLGSDAALCDRVRHLSTTARVSSEYEHDAVGFNYRLTNLQAAVGCAQLEQLDAFVAAKRRIAARYDRELAGQGGVEAFPAPDWSRGARWLAGIVVRDRPRASVLAALAAEGIGARAFWRPMTLQRPYRDAPREPTPHCDAVWASIVTLPCSTQLGDDEQTRVIEAVRQCLA
jgi:dTDP-4-amino-4,6-dideoxygalactose transaminase